MSEDDNNFDDNFDEEFDEEEEGELGDEHEGAKLYLTRSTNLRSCTSSLKTPCFHLSLFVV